MESPYLECLALFGVGGAHPGGLRLTKKILSNENISNTITVLDVGCGTGQTSAYIAEEYGCKVISLDNSKTMLDKATERFQSLSLPIEVKKGSAENIPLEDGSVDMILSESVLAFTDLTSSVPELRRVLKKDGILLAIEMVLEKSVPKEKLRSLLEFYGFSKMLTEYEWHELFQQANFKNIKVENYKLTFDEHDIQNAADFYLSDDIDDHHYEVLEKHEYYTKVYKDILGFRILKCKV